MDLRNTLGLEENVLKDTEASTRLIVSLETSLGSTSRIFPICSSSPCLSFSECGPLPVASKAEPDHGGNWKRAGESLLWPQQESEVFSTVACCRWMTTTGGRAFVSPAFIYSLLWWGSTLSENAAGTEQSLRLLALCFKGFGYHPWSRQNSKWKCPRDLQFFSWNAECRGRLAHSTYHPRQWH